ncbi:MAG: AMP-binding protein [Pseudolabrys sp.]
MAVLAIWKRGGVPVLGARLEDAEQWPGKTAVWRYADGARVRDGAAADAPAPAVIHASSGTTGRAKLAQRSFESLLLEAERYVERYGLHAGQRAFVAAPIEHSFAFGALLGVLAAGAHARLASVFHPRALARELDGGAADVVVLTPPMARLALEAGESAGARPKAPIVITGAGVVPDALDDAFRARFGCGLARNYGCSETGATFGAADSLPQGCLGRPFVGVTVQAPLAGAPADELVLDVAHAVLGLEGGAPSAAHAAGLWRTGDIAEHRHDGTVVLLGRADDRLKVNGHSIDGWELAARARALANVSDAVALALPRAGRAEIQDVVLLCESDQEEVVLHKLLRTDMPLQLVTVSRFPRTVAGKPDRQALEQLARARLGGRLAAEAS